MFPLGFPGGSDGSKSTCNAGDPGLIPGLGPTPVFLSGEFHGQRSLESYSPWGCKESDWATNTFTFSLTKLKQAFFLKLRQTLFFFPFTHPSTHLVCSCSVTQSCPTLCDPLDCSTPGFPVHHNLLETVCSVIHFTCQVWAHHWVEKMKHAFGLESLKCKCKIVWDMCNEWSYESSKYNPHYV